jgi:hypothetical protein
MKRSNFSVEDSQKDENHALPYREEDGKYIRLPFRNITTVGPAGSINSSAREMSNWVLTHLSLGKFKGEQIIKTPTLQDMHLAHMPTGGTPALAEVTPADYGMGWFVDTYRGHRRVSHGGNIDGFSALVSMMPQDNIGLVVLTNKNGTGLPELLVRHAYDKFLEDEDKDWIALAAKQQAEGEEVGKEAEKKKKARRVKGTQPAHKIDAYAGDYFHHGYGDLKVFFMDKKLAFSYNGIETRLEHWHYETFNGLKIKDPTFENMKLNFHTDEEGNVDGLEARFEMTMEAIRFDKKPDAKYFDPEYLKKYVGSYSLLNQVFKVSLRGNSLTILLPGQPEMELVPKLGGEFDLQQIKAISIRFLTDEAGSVTALEFNQPGGIFKAERTDKSD